jgi:hypothetical protein
MSRLFATRCLCYVLIMAEAPTDVVLQILIKIQDSIVAQATRLERIENLVRKQRREGAGMLVMMRATVSDFDERVGDVEERLAVLEAKQPA